MKRSLILVAAFALAACGGGGAGGGTVIPPTPTPHASPSPTPVPFTLRLGWAGPLAATGVPNRTTITKRAALGGSGSNVLLVSADTTNPAGLGASTINAIVFPEVSPAPSPSAFPTTTFTTNSAVATLAPTPSPEPSASPQPPSMLLKPTVLNATETGKSVQITVASPVSATVTAGTTTYQPLSLVCNNVITGEFIGGVQLIGTTFVNQPDPAQADLYWTAPAGYCVGAFVDPTAGSIHLNYPGGGKWYDSTSFYDAFATSDWANSGTAISYTNINAQVGETSTNATLIFKTRGGVYVKYHWYATAPYGITGMAQVHGSSIDGF